MGPGHDHARGVWIGVLRRIDDMQRVAFIRVPDRRIGIPVHPRMPKSGIQRVDIDVVPGRHAAGLLRARSAFKIDGHRIPLIGHEGDFRLEWVYIAGGQGYDVLIHNELRRSGMHIVIGDREVSCVRKRPYDDELVGGIDLVKYLSVNAV